VQSSRWLFRPRANTGVWHSNGRSAIGPRSFRQFRCGQKEQFPPLRPLCYRSAPDQVNDDVRSSSGRAEKTKPADFYAGLRYRPLASKSRFSFTRSWFIRDATGARGDTLVTTFEIERHQHEAAGVLKETVRPDAVKATYRWMETLPGSSPSDHGSEYEPADFHAGLRNGPLVRKSWFSFAPS
jgi:hypothetical protein